MFTTTITQAELLYGVELLPQGSRRARLQEVIQNGLSALFAGRILSFDESAAREFASIVASRRTRGRPISEFDAAIAGIARSHHAAIATRDTGGFEGCGIAVINPWLHKR